MSILARAGMDLATGGWVELRREKGSKEPVAVADGTLLKQGGVAVPYPRHPRRETIHKGELCTVETDGGILARLVVPATVTIRGVPWKFNAGDHPYLEMRDGRVVGFLNDHLYIQ